MSIVLKEKTILKGYTTYGNGDHLGQETNFLYINFRSYSPLSFKIKVGFLDRACRGLTGGSFCSGILALLFLCCI